MPNKRVKTKAHCFIEQGGKVLLTEDKGRLGWSLPGGKGDEAETLRQTVRREVKEETALSITLTNLVQFQQYHGRGVRVLLRAFFTAKISAGRIKLKELEVKRAQWFSRQELAKLQLKDFESLPFYEAVQAYLAGDRYPLSLLKELTIKR